MASTKYIACGKDRKQLTILKSEQSEQSNWERSIAGGGEEKMVLINAQQTQQVPTLPSNMKEVNQLTYNYDPAVKYLQYSIYVCESQVSQSNI
jgi:hypothetical protein